MIPISSDQMKIWTPETLQNLPTPPQFWLKPFNWRDEGKLQDRILAEGLSFHDDETLDAEILRALKSLSSPEVFERESGKFIVAQHARRNGDPIDPTVAQDTLDLIELVRENWPPYNKMLSRNHAFRRMWPKIVASLSLAGWKGLETPFAREAGWVPMDTIAMLAKELDRIDGEIAPGSEGASFMLLVAEAAGGMGLTETQRKNSSSESPPTGTPDGSAPIGTKALKAQSKSSPETPARKKSASGHRTSRPRKTSRT